MFKYSPSARGFFLVDLHGEAIPPDAVDVSDEQHEALLEGQQRGMLIVPDENGAPTLVDRPAPSRDNLLSALRAVVQQRLDAESQAQGFRGMADAVSYADEPAVPSFQAKGQALRAWRSLVWAAANQALAAADLPAATDLLAALPAPPAH